jgi:hypothetical protein
MRFHTGAVVGVELGLDVNTAELSIRNLFRLLRMNYQVTVVTTPKRTSSAKAKASTTAHVSSESAFEGFCADIAGISLRVRLCGDLAIAAFL